MSTALSFLAPQQQSHSARDCRHLPFLARRAIEKHDFSGFLPGDISIPHFKLSLVSKKRINFTRVHQTSDLERSAAGDRKDLFDAFLEIAEVVCIASSAIIAIGVVVYTTISNSHNVPISSTSGLNWNCLASRLVSWQLFMLVGALGVGSLIRTRQWNRFDRKASVGSGSILIERIEKLEEDVRSSVTIIRVLSRQLEKLGIRFRVTRKSLKQPIAETAALAQKNSEVTRALTIQEDILERELSEVQKVLLAMQEQQHKQLELILAIAKAGRSRENQQQSAPRGNSTKPPKPVQQRLVVEEVETQKVV